MRHAVVLLLVALAAGCGDQGDSRASAEGEVASRVPAGGEVQVGAILGLTGPYSQYGKRMKAGYDLALDALAKGDYPFEVELLVEDSKFDPATAVRAYQQLRNVRGVTLFAGITGSRNAAAVCAATSEDDEVVILDPLSSAPSLTETCGSNYFRIMPSDALAGRAIVAWAVERGLERLAVVHVLDDWGNSYSQQIAGYLQEEGLSPVLMEGVNPGERDYSAVVSKIQSEAPDGLFLLLYASDAAAFMQQLRTRNQEVQVFGSDNLSTDEFLAAGADVVEGTSIVLPSRPEEGPHHEGLRSAYDARFGTSPPEGVVYDVNVTKSYDALMLMAEAIEAVGPSASEIRSYLRNLEDYRSVSGPIRFDENGDLAIVNYDRFVFRNGSRVPAEG